MEARKKDLLVVLNEVFKTVKYHKSLLTTFCGGDNHKLEEIEAGNSKVSIINYKDSWGINALALIHTILQILIDDNLIFVTDETGFIQEVLWDSQLKEVDPK